MNTHTTVALVISGFLIGGALLLASPGSATTPEPLVPTVSVVDGTQVIDITAKGGYSPRVVTAKAGIPTVVRVTTKGTFDCSASLVIPALSYQKFLQPSGVEEISLSGEQAQGTLQGLCSMGMYNFQIRFE
jgi:plastocyanin domain-containing protein